MEHVPSEVTEIAGEGIRATLDGKNILAGSEKLMARYKVPCSPVSTSGTAIHIADDGIYRGCHS